MKIGLQFVSYRHRILLTAGPRPPRITRMSTRNLVRVIAAAVAVAASVACNTSDPRILEAAETLVPPQSEVSDVAENTGLSFEVGEYSVTLTISDGGLGQDLTAAIKEQAEAAGWVAEYEEEIPAGVRLGYQRDGLHADVSVRTEKETINAAIRVVDAGT